MRGSFARYFLSRILRTFWNNAHGFERRATSFICFKLFSTCKRVQSPRKEAAKVFLAEILVRDPPRWSSPRQVRQRAASIFISARSTARAVEPRAHAGDTGRTSTARVIESSATRDPGVARSIDSVPHGRPARGDPSRDRHVAKKGGRRFRRSRTARHDP